MINSDWYKERLLRKQQIDIQFLQERITYINKFTDRPENLEYVHQLELDNNLRKIKKQLEYIRSAEYLRFLEGTIGADPIYRK